MSDLVKRLHALSNELVSIPDSLGEQFVVPNEAAAAIERKDAALRDIRTKIGIAGDDIDHGHLEEASAAIDEALAAIDAALRD